MSTKPTRIIDNGCIPKVEISREIKEIRIIKWSEIYKFADPPSFFMSDLYGKRTWDI